MEFYILILLLIIQRLYEVSIGEKNFKRHEAELISPLNIKEKKQMIIMHSLWFLSMMVEYQIHGKIITQPTFMLGLAILFFCQFVRFQTMRSLKGYWTHLPVVFKNQKIIDDGPYTYLRHPNYLAVIIEIALVPLLGSLIWTAVIFSILNIMFILRRITIEEAALNKLQEYRRLKMKKRIIPLMFSLTLMIHSAWAETIKFKTKNFDEAKDAPTYFMFEGHSKKFGMVTTSFQGYAKEGELIFEDSPEKIGQIKLSIDSKKIDTDNGMRDEKMQDKCLDSDKFPLITVEIQELSKLSDQQVVEGVMTVKEKKVKLPITVTKKGNTYLGKTSFKLSEADIPDPSIAIAKVKDQFDVRFQVKLEKP